MQRKLFIFDKDGTLVRFLGSRPANTPGEQVLLPGVADKISTLREQGHAIALASNQGGVELGFISHEQADLLMRDCATKIGGADAWVYCPHFTQPCECRKPKPGMLVHLMQCLGFAPADTVMVGDQPSDQRAAEAAGVQFILASDFMEQREMRAYRTRNERNSFPSTIEVECPYCSEWVLCYKWSFAANGKKCPKCGALHNTRGSFAPIGRSVRRKRPRR